MFCKLFGHKFVKNNFYDGTQYVPKLYDFCVRCGLKKEEIDLKKIKHPMKEGQIIKNVDVLDEILKK